MTNNFIMGIVVSITLLLFFVHVDNERTKCTSVGGVLVRPAFFGIAECVRKP